MINKVTNLFFIHRFPFTKEAFIRDEFQYFIDLGYNVKYLDISSLLKKRNFNSSYSADLETHIIQFSSRSEFTYFLKNNSEQTLIITDVGFRSNSAWMYIPVFRLKIPYIIFENAILFNVNKTSKSTKLGIKKFFKRLSLNKVFGKPYDIVLQLYAKVIVQPAQIIISTKTKLSSSRKALIGKDTQLKNVASLDYLRALNISDISLVNEPYAVFIDQYFIHHPDFKTNHIVHYFTADEYYTELNKFLKVFSAQTGLKVVVAAHPRRINEPNNDFEPEFDLFFNKTAQLVKYAEISLIHFSTAINFSVIFKKPFLLLNSSFFKNSSVEEEIKMLSGYFKSSMINVTDFLANNDSLNLSDLRPCLYQYDKYFSLFISPENSCNESFSKTVLNFIQSL